MQNCSFLRPKGQQGQGNNFCQQKLQKALNREIAACSNLNKCCTVGETDFALFVSLLFLLCLFVCLLFLLWLFLCLLFLLWNRNACLTVKLSKFWSFFYLKLSAIRLAIYRQLIIPIIALGNEFTINPINLINTNKFWQVPTSLEPY